MPFGMYSKQSPLCPRAMGKGIRLFGSPPPTPMPLLCVCRWSESLGQQSNPIDSKPQPLVEVYLCATRRG